MTYSFSKVKISKENNNDNNKNYKTSEMQTDNFIAFKYPSSCILEDSSYIVVTLLGPGKWEC